MLQHRIAKRYAKALFLVGIREGLVDSLGSELQVLAQIVHETPGLLSFLANPATPAADKTRLLEEILARTELSAPVQRFLRLLLQNRRVQLLPEISGAYQHLVDEAACVIRGTITSAEALSSKQVGQIQKALEASTGKRVELTSEVDSTLLAGFRVHVADVTLDASILGQLNAMTSHLRATNT